MDNYRVALSCRVGIPVLTLCQDKEGRRKERKKLIPKQDFAFDSHQSLKASFSEAMSGKRDEVTFYVDADRNIPEYY